MSTSDGEFDEAAWRRELESHRETKDDFFATERQSPIPPEEREAFDGLDYFPPDADYRVTADLEPVDEDETVTMETTVETEVEYERVARLRFGLDGADHSLVAYRQVDGDGASLFVPFRDKTTGQQTYGAGRYMEFEIGEARSVSEQASGEGERATTGGSGSDSRAGTARETSDTRADGELADARTVTLDFNLAYHPFCAYNEAFACPLPPEENWLDVAIEAGERLPER